MPAWDDYKRSARSRGALALELYVAESTPAQPERLPALLADHLAYQAEREADGSLAFAGPLSDDSGEQMLGAGLIVYRAESLEAARALADADPMHAQGVRTYRLRRWLVNEGSLRIELKLSAQAVSL